MSRTIMEYKSSDNEKNKKIIEGLFNETGLEPVREKGEDYWLFDPAPLNRCKALICFKFNFKGDTLILEGWFIKPDPLCPMRKSKTKELDFNNFKYAVILQKNAKNIVKSIEVSIV